MRGAAGGRASAGHGFGSFAHLAGRLAGSLRPGGPGVADEAWARHWLGDGERRLWAAMSGPDRRHAVGVARKAASDLSGNGDGASVARDVMAAALLHDVGKIRCGLGTWGRVGATVAAIVLQRPRVAGWSSRSHGWRARTGLYVCHDRLGAELLAEAGAAPLTVAWARQHHLPPAGWTIDPRVAAALGAADGD